LCTQSLNVFALVKRGEEQILQSTLKFTKMKKMEKTAGEKTGKDMAIRKDNEASAEKIVVPDNPPKESNEKKSEKRETDAEIKNESTKKEPRSETQKEKSTTQTTTTEKGKGLKSAVEGRNADSPLPTDDDGAIVL